MEDTAENKGSVQEPPYIIEAEGLTVRFGDFTAVDSIDISVREGEIYGFLGPNGAGKTTSVKVLTTMRKPTSGVVRLGGMVTSEHPREVRDLVGVVQQNIALDMDISVRENIISKAALHKVPKDVLDERMATMCDAVGLTPYLDKIPRNLSGGWKRKTAIVCALVHQPKILFLDEPTAGLDTQSRHMLWGIIRLMNSLGTSVFLTTHYMDEAEALCDRVAIISKGKIKDIGTPRELCKSLGQFCVEYEGEGGRMNYRFFDGHADAKAFYDTVADKGATLRGTHLEDVFLEETGRADAKAIQKALRI